MINHIKCFNVRLPYDAWEFVKEMTIRKECSMNAYLVNLIKKEMTKHKKDN